MKDIKSIIEKGSPKEKRALFAFDMELSPELIVLKFNIFVRYLYEKYFPSEDAFFHNTIDTLNAKAYKEDVRSFLDIVFRGGAKTTRTKLFLVFCILNDESRFRKFTKILSYDRSNSKQFVTDMYNMLIQPRVKALYPETFEKTETKREETMGAFTTATGVKISAGTVGQSQRGDVQEETRPDLVVFDDFETRVTLRSAVVTKSIWDNMQEAIDGLSKDGSVIYLCNYISEMGNVHKLVTEKIPKENQLIVPIVENEKPTWQRYTREDIKRIKAEADDWEGEYLCRPDASQDIYFDRSVLDAMATPEPIDNIAEFKMYKKYNPSHRYAGGHDIAGGVGLDSSTSVFIDFSTIPAQVVGTYYSNIILPEAFGDEIYAESKVFGKCLVAPENNKFDQTILKAKQLGANLYQKAQGKTLKTIAQGNPTFTYGWNTNSLTKSNMFADLRKVVNDGLLVLNDPNLIQEAKSFTRNDVIDKEPDPRLVTRHFDLLTACAIAWQMKDHAEAEMAENVPSYYEQPEPVNPAE